MHILKIKILDSCPNSKEVRDYYQNKISGTSYNRDCGVDLIFPSDMFLISGSVTKCRLGIACELVRDGEEQSGPFDLVARSSIVNTPLSLANGIGIFDPEYRGEVIAAFRCFKDPNHRSTDSFGVGGYIVSKGDRLVQIVAPDRAPIRVILVDELSSTSRGENGFGSTNS